VYVVTGSAGQVGGQKETYPHNAMYYSNSRVGGAGMIEVEGNRLDFKWICADGEVRDRFTMMKDVNQKTIMKVKRGSKVTLTASYVGTYEWNVKNQQARSIEVTPPGGTTVYTVKDKNGCLRDRFEVQVSR
jgi:acid phosphatase type 7